MKSSFLLGAAVGAAAMYLLDPDNGRGRRHEAQRMAHDIAESPTAQKVVGQAREYARPLTDTGPDSGATLADKVSSEVLGSQDYGDLSINISAHDGTVTLRGVVDDTTLRSRLLDDVRSVGGVKNVESFLHSVGETPANMKS